MIIKEEIPDKPDNVKLRKPRPCKKCDAVFSTINQLSTHRKIHRSSTKYVYNNFENIYNCNVCPYTTHTKDEIEKHVEEHGNPYECVPCNQTFESAYKYGVHMYSHDSSDYYPCPMCDIKTLTSTTALRIHINTKHLNKFVYRCQHCGKGFQQIVKLNEHENSHFAANKIACVVCNKEFLYSDSMLTHQLRFHKVTIEGILLPNQCHICKKTFVKSATLTKHLKHHDTIATGGSKDHLCDVCGKSFRVKDGLDYHYRIHTGDKPFPCTHCPKKFSKKEYLIMHERTHTGEKPFKCKYCEKGFNQRGSFKIHVRTHTGERPYICHLCNKGFVSRTVLNQHLKICKG